jgi:hypothetical protein
MTPRAMVATALLLGAFVAAAGAYGTLYCLFRLWRRPALKVASYVCYGILCAVTAAILVLTPLHFGWKILIAASCAAYLAIPPVTWRYLQRLHREERTSHDSGLAQHADRPVPRQFRRA